LENVTLDVNSLIENSEEEPTYHAASTRQEERTALSMYAKEI
jgi:hypothetical protein